MLWEVVDLIIFMGKRSRVQARLTDDPGYRLAEVQNDGKKRGEVTKREVRWETPFAEKR